MMKKIGLFCMFMTILFLATINIYAEENIVEESTQTQEIEKRESKENINDDPNPRLRAALTVPNEDDYDKTVDKKDTKGKLIQRSYYKGNILRQERFYSYDSNYGINKLNKKVLYWSDGKTIERVRLYGYHGSMIYNKTTERFRSDSTKNWYLIYNTDPVDRYKEWRYYTATGTQYTYINYYDNGGFLKTRNIYSQSPYKVTQVNEYEGDINLLYKSTQYYDYSAKKVSKLTNYKYGPNEWKINETSYRSDGTKIWHTTYHDDGIMKGTMYYNEEDEKIRYTSYNVKGNNFQTNYYDEYGYYTREVRYHDDTDIWKWEVIYQEGNNKKDIVTYRDIDNVVTRKLRYFEDGSHLRWDIDYVNGEKDSVKLYDNKNNYEYKETYKYTENDKELEKNLEQLKNEVYDEDKNNIDYLSVFNNEALAKFISNFIKINSNSTFYIEDVKIIRDINIENANLLADNYSILFDENDTILEELEENEDGEYEVTGETSINNEEIKEELSSSVFDTLDGIGYLTELRTLKINNGLISNIPDEIQYLDKLKTLNLENNEVIEVSLKLDNITSLEEINLSDNYLTTTEKYFSNLINLKSLNLKNNPNILFISNDLIKHQENNNLETIKLNSNVNFKDSDIPDFDVFYDLNYFDIDSDKLNIDNTPVVKIYKEDIDIDYFDTIVPNLTKNIIKDLNNKNIGSGNIGICYVNDDPEYQIDVETNDSILKRENINCQIAEELDIKEKIDNTLFSKNGTYIVYINIENKKLNIEHSVIVRKYNTTVAQEIEKLSIENQQEIDDSDDDPQLDLLDLDDNVDTIISQTELKEFHKEEKAMSQLEDLEDQYNIAEMDGYAGAYLDDEKNIIIQFSNNNIDLMKKKSKSLNSINMIKYKEVDKSNEELEDKSNQIINEIQNTDARVSIDYEINKLVISVAEGDYEKVTTLLKSIANLDDDDYTVKTINNINLELTKAKKVNMGTKYKFGNKNNNPFATYGFRLKKKVYYCKKTKNGKCKRDKKGKIIYSKKYKWIYGATVPYHDEKAKGTSYYSGKTYVGKKYKRSKSTDTDIVRFYSKYAKPQKKVSKYGKYHYVVSKDTKEKVIVKNATVWKIYKSLYKNRALVSGKITSPNAKTNEISNLIVAEISNTYGDSGGPLITKYNKKSYIIGTSHAGVTDKDNKDYSGPESHYINSSSILKMLKAKSY